MNPQWVFIIYQRREGGKKIQKYSLIFSVFISLYRVLKLQSAPLQEHLLATAIKHNKKKVLLIGDLGDRMRAYRYPEQNEIEEKCNCFCECVMALQGGITHFPLRITQDG